MIEDGPGEGQRLLPVENTSQTVDIDLIGNTMRAPERERLSLILNELGTGVAGRGRDLNEVIRRANPALRETDKVLEILAEQNTVLEQLAVNSDTVLAPLARDRARVAGAIRNSSDVARATAERREDLAADIETLPEFLDELEPTMVRLGSLADESTPVLRDLGANAPAINPLVRDLGPVLAGRDPGRGLARRGVQDRHAGGHRRAARDRRHARPGERDPAGRGATCARCSSPSATRDGIERLMDYIFYQVAADQRLRRGRPLPARRADGQPVRDLRGRARRGLLGELPAGQRLVVVAEPPRERGRGGRRGPGAAAHGDRAGAGARPAGRARSSASEAEQEAGQEEASAPSRRTRDSAASAAPTPTPGSDGAAATPAPAAPPRRRSRRAGAAPPPPVASAPEADGHADADARPVERAARLPVRQGRPE